MSKEIGPREKALREMREEKLARLLMANRVNLMLELVPLPKKLKRQLTKAIDEAAKKRGKPRKAKKK